MFDTLELEWITNFPVAQVPKTGTLVSNFLFVEKFIKQNYPTTRLTPIFLRAILRCFSQMILLPHRPKNEPLIFLNKSQKFRIIMPVLHKKIIKYIWRYPVSQEIKFEHFVLIISKIPIIGHKNKTNSNIKAHHEIVQENLGNGELKVVTPKSAKNELMVTGGYWSQR